MTKEEIEKGNRLIAEFMGAYVKQREGRPIGDFHGFGCYPNGTVSLMASGDKEHCEKYVFYRNNYHESWSWLMPVLEKAESIGYRVTLKHNLCEIVGKNFNVTYHSVVSTIHAGYNAATDFIEWYLKIHRSRKG